MVVVVVVVDGLVSRPQRRRRHGINYIWSRVVRGGTRRNRYFGVRIGFWGFGLVFSYKHTFSAAAFVPSKRPSSRFFTRRQVRGDFVIRVMQEHLDILMAVRSGGPG